MSRSSSRIGSAAASLANSDNEDPLHGVSERVVPSRAPTAPKPEVELHIEGLGRPLKLAVDAGPGCGGITWPSGEIMSRYLALKYHRDPSYLRGKKIVELGSGTGLVGLVAGLLEPTCECWITDQTPLLTLMAKNTELNFPSVLSTDVTQPTSSGPMSDTSKSDAAMGQTRHPIHVAELDWGTPLTPELDQEWDMILAADCVYFEPAFPLLVKTLCLLAPIGAKREILFCWKKRRKADKRFFKLLFKHFSSITIEDDKPGERERYEREGIRLIRLTRIK